MNERPVALVTGASSGIGQHTARLLAESGYRVFGTSRELRDDSDAAEMLSLDVTSEESIDSLVADLFSRTDRLDLLVNNAGQSHRSLIEETSLEDARALFEVNFWGIVRLTKRILPRMREQAGGRIINISSLAGLVGTPGQGYYGAAKHAVEGYCETLRAELGHLPIELCLVEPGFFRTGLAGSMIPASKRIDDYDRVRESLDTKIKEKFEGGGDPIEVAERIVAIAKDSNPPFRSRVGKDAKQISRLSRWLPDHWFIQGTRRSFGMEG